MNTPAHLTAATTQVKQGFGHLMGLFCASASTGTVAIYDTSNSTTSGAVILVNTFSLTAGTWYNLPFDFNQGMYVVIGGTADITVSYQ